MKLFQIEGLRRRKQAEERPLRVFVTGATGYIGSAIVRELSAAGHEVTGMTRWAENTLDIKELGGRAVVGELLSSGTFRRIAAGHDVLIHAASDRTAQAEADRAAVEALLWAARQYERAKDEPPRAVIYTSGVLILGDRDGEPAGEDAAITEPAELVRWRPEIERAVLDAATEDVATAVIRPGMVYGGARGLIGELFRTAEEEGAAAFVGNGSNRWAPVYRGDLARLYRLVAEQRARGIFHAAEPQPVPVGEIARAASKAAGAEGHVRSIPLDEARERMGPLADALTLDQAMACPRSAELGWSHEHAPFVESAADVYREWKSGER